jgi:glycosyltransferase involved in cell wall biosynthesis
VDTLKIAIIGTVGVPASYGGLETLVEYLLEDNYHEITVYCSGLHFRERVKSYKSAELIYLPLSANGISSIFYDCLSLFHAVLNGQRNILVLGAASAILFKFLLVIFPSLRIVVNVDGLEWRRQKWGRIAKLYLRFATYLAIRHSYKVIADNDAIAEFITENYGIKAEVIAYGGDHAIQAKINENALSKISSLDDYALGVCRIEPENNIEIILEAFKQVKRNIIFIGNWDASEFGRQLYEAYSQFDNIILLHPVYCIDELYTYRINCKLYVHGHSVGGTNPSLVEAMYFDCPIIAFDCVFNRATLENQGRYFDSIESLITEMNVDVNDVPKSCFKEIALRRYTWENIRLEYFRLFS